MNHNEQCHRHFTFWDSFSNVNICHVRLWNAGIDLTIYFFHCKLHIAAANAYEEVLEFLLENEADVDVEDKDGWKPIHAAACWGNVRFINSVMLVA